MPTDVIMPQMGESIFEGTITKWLKQVGDPVAVDEPLFEISTDKVDAEIPAHVAGVLTEIKFPEGSTVQVNQVVATIGASATGNGAKAASASTKHSQPAQTQPNTAISQEATPPQVSGGTPVVMPQMGESIFEGTITKWLKQVGDSVVVDEPLYEISTDKVDAEIPAHVAGVLTEIKYPEGSTVQVNTVVAVIGGTAKESGAFEPVQNMQSMPVPIAAASQPESAQSQLTQGNVKSSPLVRKIAKEHGVNLAMVKGTGAAGRVNKADILAYISSPERSVKKPTPPQAAHVPAPALEGKVEPMSKMRSIIAERMLESARTIPHAHNVYKIDMTRIAKIRERERADFEQRHGVKLTYMPFIASAAIHALQHHPIVNASLEGSNIRYHAHIELGIAVALEWGLIVPVIRHSETANFVTLARAIADLGARARTKKLQPSEVGGSTFTLTNAGVFGGEFGMPIVNAPESAILAIGGLRKEPVVLTDHEGNDTIAIRSVQYYCLGFDHRLIDGADSGKFMTTFKNTLENWNHPIG
ncbi:MAG: 2-oxoglutarate dehydrogenase, E2 component, dihydrolipoamide succinyltransferase [Acidobacteriota bacterium]|nr:2-oxoglutarate dehydrogenase, E2 component, dihydrolipoamide succinyltransferase [Acidobacteriota bacterium]